MRRQITDANAIRAFMKAGRAVFTIKSLATGAHITYKMSINKKQDAYWVSTRRGAGEKWTYIGVVNDERGVFYATRKPIESQEVIVAIKGFAWFWRQTSYEQVEFYHEGQCGKCGRELTDPDSIERGLGPKCAGLR